MPHSENTELCASTNIPYLKLQLGTQPCLFVHANGYPSHCYLPMLQQLKGCTVWAPLSRPCWATSDPNAVNQWPLLVDDFLKFARARVAETKQPMIAIGHSMGCIVILRAAIKEPDLFKKIIFLDPIFMPSYLVEFARMVPKSMMKKIKLVTKTLNRPDQWSSLQQAFDFHRTKRAFKALPDTALWQYIIGGTKPVGEQWHLKYPKAWEAWFYQNLPRSWRYLRKLSIPTLGIKAEHSEFLSTAAWQKWQKIQPHEKFIEFEAKHHLLPMESPVAVAHAILDFIEQ